MEEMDEFLESCKLPRLNHEAVEKLKRSINCTEIMRDFLLAQLVKNLPAMQETWVQFLGWEDPLEKETATDSSMLAWEIPRTEEPGRLQSIEWQRVGHDSATHQQEPWSKIKVLTLTGPSSTTLISLQ